MDDECQHGMDRDWCAQCRGTSDQVHGSQVGGYGFHGGQSKQELLNEMCDLLGLQRESVGVGSSLPSRVFETAASRTNVQLGSMPEIGERLASRAGLAWGSNCDSRGTISGGGSTVTLEGLSVVVRALRALL